MTTFRLHDDERTTTDLITAAKRGSERAWEEIYETLAGPVTGYLRSRGAADPEDLCSEVFLQVARDIRRFDGSAEKFRSWVFVIAHRRLIDSRRASARRIAVVDRADDDLELEGGNVEEEVLESLGATWTERVLDTLTEDQRQVLALRIVADLSLEQTAAAMGKRVGAVKALQRRALSRIKTQLAKDGVS